MPAHAAQSNNSHTSTPPSDAAIAAVSARRSAFRTRRESAPPRFRRYDWRWPPKILAHGAMLLISRGSKQAIRVPQRILCCRAGDLPPRSHIGMIASESVVPRSAAKRAGGRFVCFGTYLTYARLTLIRDPLTQYAQILPSQNSKKCARMKSSLIGCVIVCVCFFVGRSYRGR